VRVSGDPDRLERYSEVALDAVEPARTSRTDYGDAVSTYLSASPNDFGAGGISDRTAAVTTALSALRDLDEMPAAFAYALRALDNNPNDGYSITDVEMFDALVQARLEEPDGTARDVWQRALDIRYGSGTEIGNELRQMIDELDGLDDSDVDRIMALLSNYVSDMQMSGDWDGTVNWTSIAYRGQAQGLSEELDELGVSLEDLDRVFEALDARGNDDAFLTDLFDTLGPVYATRVPELLSMTAYREVFNTDRHEDNADGSYDVGFDPQEYARTYSEALANASNLRDDSRAHVLGNDWWGDFFSNETVLRDGDLNDNFPPLFMSGEFRPDVAEAAGNLGVRVLDHDWDVNKGAGSPLYDGFEELETHWEDRGGMMLDAASRVPEAANEVLLGGTEYDDGLPFGVYVGGEDGDRPNIEVILDASYDNMNPDRVGEYYGRIIEAGTLEAEQMALDRPGVDDDLLRETWEAKQLIIDEVAGHHGSDDFPDEYDGYPPALNESLTDVAISIQPHTLSTSVLGSGPTEVEWHPGDDPTLLGREHGIAVHAQDLGDFYATLMEDDEDRLRLVSAANATQLNVLGEAMGTGDTDLLMEGLGRSRAALLAGHLEALDNEAERVAAEIEASNQLVDQIYGGTTTALGLIPGPGTALKVTTGALSFAGAFDIDDLLLDQLKGDADAIREQAHTDGVEDLVNAPLETQQLVLDAGYLRLREDLAATGGDPQRLPAASRALYDVVEGFGHDPAATTLGELRNHADYDNIATAAADDEDVLQDLYEDVDRAFDDAYPELDLPRGG